MASANGHVPQQGDHVFNDLATVALRPFEVVSAIGRHAPPSRLTLQDFMPLAISEINHLFRDPRYTNGRTYTSEPTSEPGVLRILDAARNQHPVFRRISTAVLQSAHTKNSTAFGNAGLRFESEVLRLLLNAVTVAIDRPGQPIQMKLLRGASAMVASSPSIAAQSLIKAAFDPAAALVFLVHTAYLESPSLMPAVLRFAAEIAETVEPWKPESWDGVIQNHRLPPSSGAGRAAAEMVSMWGFLRELRAFRMELLFTRAINEIAGPSKGRIPDSDWQQAYSEAIAAIYAREQQIASRRSGNTSQ